MAKLGALARSRLGYHNYHCRRLQAVQWWAGFHLWKSCTIFTEEKIASAYLSGSVLCLLAQQQYKHLVRMYLVRRILHAGYLYCLLIVCSSTRPDFTSSARLHSRVHPVEHCIAPASTACGPMDTHMIRRVAPRLNVVDNVGKLQ